MRMLFANMYRPSSIEKQSLDILLHKTVLQSLWKMATTAPPSSRFFRVATRQYDVS